MCGIFAEFNASDGSFSARVDVYNASSNSWASYPTGLGQARGYLAAASLPSGLVFFAGGLSGLDLNIDFPIAFVLCTDSQYRFGLLFALCVGICFALGS